MIRSRSYSRSNRSWIISKCISPKKPQRKPNPRALLLSGSILNDASFSCSFSRATRRLPYSSPSEGYRPAKTMDLTGTYPGKGSSAGMRSMVSVSPTLHSRTSLNPVAIYPTCPVESDSVGVGPGENTPTSTTSANLPEDMTLILSFLRMVPSFIRTWAMIPLKELNSESNTKLRRGPSSTPEGAGTLSTTASRISFAPVPSLADT